MKRTLPTQVLPILIFGIVLISGCGGAGGTASTTTPPPPASNPAPAIAKISPAAVVAGTGDTSLDVSGSGFIASTVVAWNGTALLTTVVSGTEVKATVPAADLAGSSASAVTAQNPAPGGGTSAAVTFTVNSPTPVIASIAPRYVAPGSAATITITGTGFEANSVAMWNGSARPTTVVSPTVLQVVLSAADLQSQGTGSLTVSNPGPAAATSAASQLTVTAQPIPVIQSVSIGAGSILFGACPQLQVTITGQNFAPNAVIQANAVSVANFTSPGNGTTLLTFLPIGFVSAPGALTFTVTNPDVAPIVSAPFAYPATSAPTLALCVSPSPTTVYAPSSFSIMVQPSEVNIGGNVTLTLGSLPAGITSANGSVALPPIGTTLHLQAANSTVAGGYDLALNGTAGTATAKGDFNFTVSTGAVPSFNFSAPLLSEMGVPIGGSGSIQFGTTVGPSSIDYDVTPTVSGLPPGTTATFSPSVFSVGQNVTVTLNAASNAPVTQNATVTLTGTPSAQTAAATTNFFADVTQPPGSLPGNRTDFVPTAGTPYAAVYDPTHNLIFSSNPDWNRIDVISNATHKIVKSVPVLSPRGLDITQDNAHVWVQTASLNIYSIDTVSLQAKHYNLPNTSFGSSGLSVQFARDTILALSDGTLFAYFDDSGGGGGGLAGVWNPTTNQLNVLSSGLLTGWGFPARSGDGTHVYASSYPPYDTGMEVYDVGSQKLNKLGSGTGYPAVVAVNRDGSELILSNNSSMVLYDSSLNLLGTVPGAPGSGGILPLLGGILFSPDDKKLYEIGDSGGVSNNVAGIFTIDSSTLKVLGIAPSAVTDPVGTSGYAGTSTPFAVDSTGMVLALQNYGIAFEDSTFYQNYTGTQPSHAASEYIATFAGPLAGGTVSSLNVSSSLIPDVWFAQSRGTVNTSQGQLQFTSPPSSTPGPVNVKFIFPDGQQAYYPQFFSYSTFPEYALTSGSSPNGGAPAKILGYGLPQDVSGGSMTVGGNTATITTTAGQYPPLSGEPYPSTILAYTFPQGTPGWADVQITTPIGAGSLPKSVFYAKNVTDYSSTDTYTAVLFDAKRKQLYLAAGDHVDVFSTISNQFGTPLYPAAQGSQKQFNGLALTPDGSQLLATDLLDGSLGVINPDAPSNTFAIAIAPVTQLNGCPAGPLYVAATSTNQAFVTLGSLPVPSCPPYGNTYIANLQSHVVTQPPAISACGTVGNSVDATADGQFVAIGGFACVYSAQSSTYHPEPFWNGALPELGIAVSADGNVVASTFDIGDVTATLHGSIGYPIPLYGPVNSSTNPPFSLLRPRLNASGSLYYFPYPNYFEIIDVPHGILRMRFALTETIQDTGSPLAIDSGGRFVYLITDKGLTVVDLGAAPLSIGHLTPQTAGPETQVIVRGSGFDSGTIAKVGGLAATVNFTDENTLTLTIPAATSGPQDIVLTRSNGEVYTLENGVVLP
jgi:hypothetical protein